ncbi:polyprenyl synthetase family protein [Rossellomorea vietnamensis]|uniref:Farnesyl diphosphate synthase n=1 Tax=Rossellomorea vietnamensis TaxID=218284 RepID=A0A0P6WES7_9BACI|nr:farnesyl diphosphate synthase [Rossellomorea vietnamensis]KPL59645.1 farnesyl-diphosphate synthase [Rossellomorea vietnamensis]
MYPPITLKKFQQQHGESITNHMVETVERLDIPLVLKEAMIYSLKAGGKRIRPILLLAAIRTFKQDPMLGLNTASALEMIHTYSLIHDDLPSMDDDDLRRGKPTNHKMFGEAAAILAGDGLLTYSFQLIAEDSALTNDQKVKLIALLARCAGPEGMVGGQVADIEGENKRLTVQELENIHVHKTGKLLIFSVLAGGIISGVSENELELLERFSYHIGLAFQIQDDILDIEGSEEMIGKPVGSDESKHKSTYPSILTMEGAKEKLQFHLDEALTALTNLSFDSSLLEEIARLIVSRNH